MIDKKQPGNVEYFSYMSSMIINDARCNKKLNPGLPWQHLHSTRLFFSPGIWT